jgi:hypothetical protein
MRRDTSTNSQAGFGYWTEEFEQLHHAATSGAPADEVERLAAAELDALLGLDPPPAVPVPRPSVLRVAGRCPACGHDTLAVAGWDRGRLHCDHPGCPHPMAADELLSGPAREDTADQLRARIKAVRGQR